MTKRQTDINGFTTIKDNPISKVGVFPYLGREIGAPDGDRIYQVYRPAEELSKPETLESFNLLPWVDEHEMLGDGGTPAEEKGVQGTTGENAHFEAPYLRNTLRIYSDYMKRLIEQGKIELSPSYRCHYDFTPGEFEGQRYDAIQRDIRGNHLALVKQGRTGKDVAVQDHLITIDSSELIKEQTSMNEEQIRELVTKLIQEALAAAKGTDAAKPEEKMTDEPTPETQAPMAAAAVENAEVAVEQAKEATASAQEAAQSAEEAIEAVKEEIAADSVTKAIKQIADRDALAKRVTPHIGVFDSAAMLSAHDVAVYACGKLGIKAQKGAEVATLDGYLQNIKAPIETVAKDSKPVSSNDSASRLWKEKA